MLRARTSSATVLGCWSSVPSWGRPRRKESCSQGLVLKQIRRRRLLAAGIALFGMACRSKTPAAHVASAAAYESNKDYSNAILEYRAALQQDPKLGEARIKLGDLYARTGDAQNAFREYVRAADTLPDNIDAQLKAGALLLLGNQFADAKTRAEKVLQLSPRASRRPDPARQRARRAQRHGRRHGAAERGDSGRSRPGFAATRTSVCCSWRAVIVKWRRPRSRRRCTRPRLASRPESPSRTSIGPRVVSPKPKRP